MRHKGKPDKLIVNRLAAVLKEEGITNKELAEELGYEATTVSKWATNTIQPPLTTFLRIALTLNRNLKDFFISTKEIGEGDRKQLLEKLAAIAEQGKRTGRDKA